MGGSAVTDDPAAAVRAQYEAYPYPARDPRDEATRLITGSPSHLDEVDHYVFAGRLRPHIAARGGRPFRALVAGGGTGDALVMLAQQCRDAALPAEIAYLDLSTASRAIAEARIAARGLQDLVTVHTGSLLEVAAITPGPWDYIDCCGVLHHLPDPAAGLAALVAVLDPDGGLGLMVYAPYGRSGVYPMQDALRLLTGDRPPKDRIALARRLLSDLPRGNLLRRNPLVGDHVQGGDAGLYDLLLHSIDRAYTVREFADLIAGAGLAPVALMQPALYEPADLLPDPALKAAAARLPWLERAHVAEALCGTIKTHIAYAVPAARAEVAVAVASREAVPRLRDLDGAALAAQIKPNQALTFTLGAERRRIPLPPLARPLLAGIDGQRPLGALIDELAADPVTAERQAMDLVHRLASIGKLTVHHAA